MLVTGDGSRRPRKWSIAVVIQRRRKRDGPASRGISRASVVRGTSEALPDERPWLLVQRPLEDEVLPGEWGLPAGSLEPDETEEALVRRIGRQKLGVVLRPARQLVSGRTVRPDCTLEMTLWAAAIASGTIRVPRSDRTVTQYRDWVWGPPEALAPGAARGSLCCRLGLEWAADASGRHPGG